MTIPTRPPASPPPAAPTAPGTARDDRGSHGDLVAGGIFVVLGLAFAVRSLGYGLGSFQEMGAGMFPFLLGVLLAALGAGVVLVGVRGGEDTPGLTRLPWRGIGFVIGALVYFAFAVPFLGFLPATAGTVLLSCLASPTTSIAKAAAATVGVTVACYVIFIVLLQLPLPLVGA